MSSSLNQIVCWSDAQWDCAGSESLRLAKYISPELFASSVNAFIEQAKEISLRR